MTGWLARLDAFDRRLFHRLTREERRLVDMGLKQLSNTANRSLLWMGIAALIAVLGGPRGRRAARRGLVSIGITSTLVNLPLKYIARRDRPPIRRGDRPLPVSLPGSFSFPSGHSASAFAFATGVGLEDPRLGVGLVPLAATVAYSRVHLRVHFPFDVLAGAAIGVGMGLAGGPLIRRVELWWNPPAPAPTMERAGTKQLILVVSPYAGHKEKLERARQEMAARGLEVMAEIGVDDLQRLPDLLRKNGSQQPIVVAAGGDGTVGAVANAVMTTPAVLGILPLGTSNDFARSIKLPMNEKKAVRLLARGVVSRVDAGKLTRDGDPPRHFVHAAAAGINVQFARFATRADLRARFGRLTYAVAMATAMKERPIFKCQIEHEGGTEWVSLVHLSVINAPIFGGFLGLKLPGSGPDDRTLDVIMIEHLPIRRLLRSALYPLLGVHRPIRGFRTLQVSRLRVKTQRSMDVTLDGEIAGTLPGTFEIVPDGLRVITSASFKEKHR
ncbi:MAG: YegS/Rv2252/BmrU family lipid kinase [Candidatus Dormibacteraeota bacterium]|nr:YegS/Rv2252/BmrU family lipid kinase [Candidatus Dormibacteraeota bacterium]